MAGFPAAAVAYDASMRQLEIVALGIGRRFWRGLNPADLSGSWVRSLAGLQPLVEKVQYQAATLGAGYGADTLAGQDTYSAPASFVDPSGFVGTAPDGRSLAGLLYSPVTQVKMAIAQGVQPGVALRMGGSVLDRNVQTLVADTGRAAASVDIVARPHVGYVRMLNLPSCPRCVILAGKYYRWNTGFKRHPRCDCRHIPTTENRAGDATTDPYEYFRSLDAEAQDKQFGKPAAQAIRDGSDIFQVVNADRGMKPGGLMTTEGTTKRGNFRASIGDATRARRLTPEAIYKLNGDNRAGALRDLERYGYILPGGQNPLGSITGQREGYGALGHGGAYSAARKRVEDAITHGRDPAVRATMTEAERRLFDAKARWELVQQGVNPYGAPSMTSRAKINTSPLTPQIAAQVEKDYRRWLSTGGQVFK